MKQRKKVLESFLLALFCVLACSAWPLRAQTFGEITGTVTDVSQSIADIVKHKVRCCQIR